MNPFKEVWSLITNLKSRPFAKNSIVLISGSAVGQVIPILTAPIVTRIYSPDDYGLLGVFMLISSLVGLLATMQIDNAIYIEKDDQQAKAVFQLCCLTSICTAIFALLSVLVLRGPISRYFNAPHLATYLILLPVVVGFTGLNNTLTAWANRFLYYKLLSVQRVSTALLTPAVSIVVGLVFKSVLGLFLGMIAGQLLTFILLLRRCLTFKGLLDFDFHAVRKIFKRHISFLKFNFPSEFINLFIAQLPGFILGRFYSLGAVGQYNLSNRMLNMPTMLVSQAVGEVFKKRASAEYHATGKCNESFKKTFVLLASISIVPFTLIYLFSPQIFSFFFGEKWLQAGIFARIMVLMFFLRFTISPLTFVAFIRGKQVVGLIGTIVYAITTLAVCVIIANNTKNVYYLLIGYVANFTWIYLIMFYVNYKMSLNHELFKRSSSLSAG